MDEGAACRGTQRRASHAECNVTVGSARVTWYRGHVAAAVAVESATSRFPPSSLPEVVVRFLFLTSYSLIVYSLKSSKTRDTYLESLWSISSSAPPLLWFPHLWTRRYLKLQMNFWKISGNPSNPNIFFFLSWSGLPVNSYLENV